MNRTDREPLTSDERALADLLARDGGQASPSAALDAAILAAAREAVAPAAPAPRVSSLQASRARRRWPFAVGIAASLALAVGIAWQLRPGPGDETPQARSEADMAAPATARRINEAAPAPPPPASAPMEPPTTPKPAPVESPATPAASEAPVVAAPAAAMDAEAAARTTRSQDARESVARDAVPAPANTSAAPVSPAAVSAERRTALGAQAFPVPAPAAARSPASPAPPPSPPAPPPAPPSPPSPPAALADVGARAQRAESQALLLESIEDMPDDIEPPATVDAPEVRAAWLARVRELLDTGRIADAKASLREFHRRHPDAELPPDLRALLD